MDLHEQKSICWPPVGPQEKKKKTQESTSSLDAARVNNSCLAQLTCIDVCSLLAGTSGVLHASDVPRCSYCRVNTCRTKAFSDHLHSTAYDGNCRFFAITRSHPSNCNRFGRAVIDQQVQKLPAAHCRMCCFLLFLTCEVAIQPMLQCSCRVSICVRHRCRVGTWISDCYSHFAPVGFHDLQPAPAGQLCVFIGEALGDSS